MKNRIIGLSLFVGILLVLISIYVSNNKTQTPAQEKVQVHIEMPLPGEDYVEGDNEEHEFEQGETDFGND